MAWCKKHGRKMEEREITVGWGEMVVDFCPACQKEEEETADPISIIDNLVLQGAW